MSGPPTIELEEQPKDYFDEQEEFINRLMDRMSKMNVMGTGHSISQTTDNSVRKNDWGPWVTLLGILAGLSLGLASGAMLYSSAITNEAVKKAQLADNHADRAFKATEILRLRVEQLERENAEHTTRR